MNRIKRRLAIAKMDLMVFEAICGPIPRLTKWQKLKYCAECIFRWKKKSIVMAGIMCYNCGLMFEPRYTYDTPEEAENEAVKAWNEDSKRPPYAEGQ